jgi:hypothetical protein
MYGTAVSEPMEPALPAEPVGEGAGHGVMSTCPPKGEYRPADCAGSSACTPYAWDLAGPSWGVAWCRGRARVVSEVDTRGQERPQQGKRCARTVGRQTQDRQHMASARVASELTRINGRAAGAT